MAGATGTESRRTAAAAIVRRLRRAGHEAWFVGGCVRDLLLGRVPGDFDVATSARPEEVAVLFPRTVAVGAHFGVLLVVLEGHPYEVATFRADGEYTDGRHPVSVRYATAETDVQRRDFTVNGLLMDPETGRIVDLVGGQDDLRARRIRTIGAAEDRFREDRLRMLRAVRFAANLGFSLDGEAETAIRRHAGSIRQVSAERIRDELTKLLVRSGARRGMEMLAETGLLAETLPEVQALRGVAQPLTWHPEGDVWDHTLRMLEGLDASLDPGREADPRLAWAVLLHDVGKADTRFVDGRGVHFYGHVGRGVVLAERILQRLRVSRAETETILALVREHMMFLHVQQMRPSRLKRFLRLPDFSLHLALHRLDCLGSHGLLDDHAFCEEKLREFAETDLRPLPLICGDDLLAWGFRPGPLFGEILRAVEDGQLEGALATPEDARRFVLGRWRPEG